ncbi:amino acid/amide ABC transporter membrane protein 2 (HAAT family) [Stackebrandtia endophytica]|uniref:Amino acid/amide ABC transporter membrane protein 2 (HAAT family) n=1 Tax=Stackebrandtia endophytica TaxID=1496996 RepID=A0A543B3Z9_9ACTN|nr:branched-chain amino acid ABC transporter permease [Stackebrandtia endophytica]TQL79554.1 amino acid/amide ABC transporter membrane protein 2 (HAAT family) [Stackebrandtia endophytica]
MDFIQILSSALQQAFGPTMLAYAICAIGLNVHFGYAGLLNFGQAGFAAVAAYGLAMAIAAFNMPFWLAIAIGLLAAVLLALLLGVPTLRLRADYLAIVTIAAAEIIRRLARSTTFSEHTGGSDGTRTVGSFNDSFVAMNPYTSGLDINLGFMMIRYTRSDLWVMTVGWGLVAVCLLVMFLAMRSPWGRVLKGIREDEQAVRSLGKNVFGFKMQALVLGGLFGALGGFVFALGRDNVQADLFSTELTFYCYVMLILGGAARLFGPLLGAMLFWFLYNFLVGVLNGLSALQVLPSWLLATTKSGPLVYVLMGAGMVLLLIYRPQGILGDKRELSLDVR